MERMMNEIDEFLDQSGFERDDSRLQMGNVITTPNVYKTLGYNQMDYYTPIKPKVEAANRID